MVISTFLSLGLVVLCLLLYISREVVILLTVLITYFIGFGVRSIYVESKDTMMCNMGEVELMAMEAAIKQALKARR